MTDLITQTARLVPYSKRPRGGNGYVTAYVHEPAPGDPAAVLGSLYVVIEVLVSGRSSEDTADLIIETFGNAYYNTGAGQPFPLARFEQAVKQTNAALANQIDRGNAAWIGKLSCIIAVVAADEVHITHTGSGEGFLYRGKAHTRITSPTNPRPVAATKTFGSIASGELEAGDHLLFSTPALIHNVPLAKLGATIASASPQGAIAEFTSLLKGPGASDRIAAIVTEITTPERAAMALRTDQPDIVELGAPQNSLQAAKLAAAPVAGNAAAAGRRAITAAASAGHRLLPLIRQAGLYTAAGVRRIFATSLGRRTAAAILVIAIMLVGFSAFQHFQATGDKQLVAAYHHAYQEYQAASTLPDDQKLARLSSATSQLTKLAANEVRLNRLLANSELPNGEPSTLQALRSQIQAQIDTLHGLTTASPTTVAPLDHTNQTPAFIEYANSKLYVIGAGQKAAIQIVSPNAGTATPSRANLTAVGEITATTLSPAGDGIYLLTKKPSVWFYRFDSDSLTEQTVAYGSWSNGPALGAYLSNLYVLGNTSIDKFVRSGTGYAPRATYTQLPNTSPAPHALAVDGSVYTLSSTKLTEYLAGVSKQSVVMPTTVDGLANLRSFASGKVLVASSSQTGRIVLFSTTNGALKFNRMVSLSGIKNLADCTYDTKSSTLFAIADNRVVSVSLGL